MAIQVIRLSKDSDASIAVHLESLHQELVEACDDGNAFRIDASGACPVDVRLLQLVESTGQRARQLGVECRITGPLDAAFADMLLRAGVVTGGQSIWPEGIATQ